MNKALWVLGGLVALLAVGCGAPGPTAPPAGESQGQPKPGGRLNFRLANDPLDWDATYQGPSAPGDRGFAQTYSSLLRFKSGPGVDFNEMVLEPELAERWEVAPDAKTYTFHLRRGAKFAPSTGSGNDVKGLNGRELTAADVKWTIEYYTRSGVFKEKKLPAGQQIGWMFEGLDRVEAPDPYTVKVSFKDPFIPFINYAASDWFPIVPREIYEADGHLKDRIIGTGPYQLDVGASQKSTRWVWLKNKDSWMAGQTYLDEIRWLILPEDVTAYAAFQTKQVDLIQGLDYPDLQELKKAASQASFHRYLQPQATGLRVSQARGGPLTDVRVRRAINRAIDRDAINKLVAGGEGLWGMTAALPGLFTETEVRQLLK